MVVILLPAAIILVKCNVWGILSTRLEQAFAISLYSLAKLTSKIYVYTHILGILSALVREPFFCSWHQPIEINVTSLSADKEGLRA